jgi:hypothetical protein
MGLTMIAYHFYDIPLEPINVDNVIIIHINFSCSIVVILYPRLFGYHIL